MALCVGIEKVQFQEKYLSFRKIINSLVFGVVVASLTLDWSGISPVGVDVGVFL